MVLCYSSYFLCDPFEIASDDEPDEIIDTVGIKSASEALQMVDRILRFSQRYGHEEFDKSLMKVTEKL